MANRGRPKKGQVEIVNRIIEAIKAGNPFNKAALLGGITAPTFYRWCSQDPKFKDQVDAADAYFVNSNIAIIQAAAKKEWKAWTAAAWLLERRHPEEFALRQVITLENDVTKEMVNRLNAGRERVAKFRDQGIDSEPSERSSQILQ